MKSESLTEESSFAQGMLLRKMVGSCCVGYGMVCTCFIFYAQVAELGIKGKGFNPAVPNCKLRFPNKMDEMRTSFTPFF